MLTRVLPLLLVILCMITFVGCEGDTGPAGPAGQDGDRSVLAFGDVDAAIGVVTLLSSGPAGVTVALTWLADNDIDITVTGSFPATQGVLLVSISSGDVTRTNVFIAGTIMSWSTSQIDLNIKTLDIVTPTAVEDFSFAVLGD